MTYYVVDPSGTKYGPADVALLQQWAREGRIESTTIIADANTGVTMLASSLPGLYPLPPMQQQQPYGQYGAPYSQPYGQQGAYYPRPHLAAGSSNDLTIAWVACAVGICGLVCCQLVPIIGGITGIVFAKRVLATGDSRGQTPLILSYISIGIGVFMLVALLIGLGSMSM